MRKAFGILIVFIIIALLAGCAPAPSTADDPAVVGEGSWEEEYVQVSNGDVLLCLWQSRGGNTGTLDCDWDNPTDKTTSTVVGQNGWEEEYVTVSTGQTILCLWHSRGGKTAVRSCDWSR